jgi:hypothetical protein
MNFGKIMNNATLFKQLNAAKPQFIEETKALLKSAEDLKYETDNPPSSNLIRRMGIVLS